MSWQIDFAHSQIQFTARHMMISKVRGVFERFDGAVALDPQTPERTSVDIQIEAASINTREAQRDAHLRSADFLNADVFPSLHFVSSKVERVADDKARLHGALTIREVTKPVVLDVEFSGQAKSPWGTVNYGFSASTKINRKDWGLVWNVALETGGLLVSEEVTINIELELIQTADK